MRDLIGSPGLALYPRSRRLLDVVRYLSWKGSERGATDEGWQVKTGWYNKTMPSFGIKGSF